MGALLWGELRRRWRSAAAIGVVLGIGFAAVLTAAAGARRTDTAFPRMLDATNAPQLLISSANEDSVARQRLYDGLADVHGVEQVAPFSGVGLVPMRVQKGAGTSMDACSNLAHDRRAWFAVGVPNVVDGRLPHPDRSDEVLVTHSWAETFGSRPGDELDLVRSGEGGVAGRITGGDGPVARATVVGVGVLAAEVVPISDLDAVPRVVAGPAFLERHAPEDADRCYDGAFVVLAQGALIDGVTADIDSMAEPVGGAFVQDLTGNYDEVRRAIQPQVTALWLFAVVSALASLLVVGQLLGRQLRHTAGPSVPVWRALGVTKSQIRALVAAPSVVTAMVGTGVAVTAAVLLSSRFPIGPARLAETARGVRVDGWIHVGGGLLAAMTALAIGLATTALVVESGARKAPVGRTARMTAAASKPAWILGIYLTADSGRGDRTVPTRSAVAGTALCVAAALSTVTFSRGLHDLVSEPARYGRDWDVMLDASFGAVPVADVLDELGDDRSVAAIAGGRYGEVTVDGRRVPTVGLTDLVGTTFPALIEGRAPGRNDEIVLGKRSLAAVGRSVGDRVSVDTGTGPVDMTVVGTAAFPRLNHGSFSTLGLGFGAAMRAEAFPPKQLPDPSELPPDFELDEFLADGDAFEFVTIRVRDGATAAERGGVVAAATRIQGPDLGVLTEQRPTAIDNYAAVSSTPAALAALLGFMAAATLAHLVVSVVRRRRRDLALCAALGMDRRQLSQAVVVQAVIVAGAALLVGLPLGVLGGRLAWTGFASELGVADQLQLPLAALSLSVPAVIVGAVAVALVPAIFASRTSPGLNLRSE